MPTLYAARRRPHAPGQGGFALLELTIAVAIACLLAIWAANRLLHDADQVAERAAGLWLVDLRRALEGVLARHGETLAGGGVPVDEQGRPAYADPWSPTVEELKAQGHLAGAFSNPGPFGMRAVIKLWRGAACPGSACRLEALAYSVVPGGRPGAGRADTRRDVGRDVGPDAGRYVGRDTGPDVARIAGVLMAADGAAASVSELAPHRLRGAAFDLPNPPVAGMAPLPIGAVAVRVDRGAADLRDYLRTRDARDPQFRGDVSTAGTLSASGRVVAGEHLKLDGVAVPGDPCPENGLLARDTDGALLNCAGGLWASPGGFGGAYSTNTDTGCDMPGRSAPNPRTGACSCPPGYRPVLVAAGGERDREVGWTEGYVCLR